MSDKMIQVTMSTEDWDFLSTGITDLITNNQELRKNPELLARFSDWEESCDSVIEQNERIKQIIDQAIKDSE